MGGDDDWGNWYEYEAFGEEDEDENIAMYQGRAVDAGGPLGLLHVTAPPAPPHANNDSWGGRSPITLLCEAPEEYRCALDGRLCQDPVRTPGGILYERASIFSWLGTGFNRRVCPVTGVPLHVNELADDTCLAECIAQWAHAC